MVVEVVKDFRMMVGAVELVWGLNVRAFFLGHSGVMLVVVSFSNDDVSFWIGRSTPSRVFLSFLSRIIYLVRSMDRNTIFLA